MIILRVRGCSRELSSRPLAIAFESLERSHIWIFRDLNSEFESFESKFKSIESKINSKTELVHQLHESDVEAIGIFE